jgi:hypothetical protein
MRLVVVEGIQPNLSLFAQRLEAFPIISVQWRFGIEFGLMNTGKELGVLLDEFSWKSLFEVDSSFSTFQFNAMSGSKLGVFTFV